MSIQNPEPRTDLPVVGDREADLNPSPLMFRGATRAQSYIEGTEPSPAPKPVPFAPRAHESGPERPTVELIEPTAAAEPLRPPLAVGDPMLADLLSGRTDGLTALDIPRRGEIARRGLRGVLNRLGLQLQPGPAEQDEKALTEQCRRDEETIRQATWTRAVSVLIANPKGGVGKTPTAILLGGVLAAARGGSVCILEVSDDPGALAFRAEGNPTRGMGELVRDITSIDSAGQLAGYTAPQTSFASVIGTVRRRPRLTGDNVQTVADVVDRFFSIRVMDSGNQPSSSAFQGALDTADALVIPTFNAADSMLEALALLEELRSTGGRAAALANNAVLLRLTDGRPEREGVVARIDSILAGLPTDQIFTVPYDAHIAERGQITLATLSPATHRAFAAAAAAVVRSLQATVS